MTRTLAIRAVLLALAVGAAAVNDARGEDQPGKMLPPPAAVPPLRERPPAYVLPPVTPPAAPELPSPDPLLDRPEAAQPGPYVNAEVSLLFVHFRNQLGGSVTVSPTQTDFVAPDGSRLNDTVSPRLEVGYQFPKGWGALQLGYRVIATQGSQTADTPLGPGSLSGILNMNVIDLDYVSREFSLGPGWEMRWTIGARFATLYYQNRLNLPDNQGVAGATLEQVETNSFWGFGPHGAVEIGYQTALSGLTVFGRVEGTDIFSRIKQKYSEHVAGDTPDAAPLFGLNRNQSSVSVPTLKVQFGLSYDFPEWNHSRILLGYEYENWFQAARFGDARGQYEAQGIFLRGEWNF
jgi:hypothetical protein